MKKKICLNEVTKSFGAEKILKPCSVQFEEGHIYGIVGRNGAGKTVLLKIISGLYQPDQGYVEINGVKLDAKNHFAENIGVIIETPGFLNAYTGFQNLLYLAQIRGMIGEEEIKNAMRQVGVDWTSRKKVGKYSLGMRQRLGIAQAIMEDPEILLLDEPMNGLDRNGIAEMRKLFLRKKEEGKLILFASHNKEDIETLCDEVYEMDAGVMSRLY